MRGDGKQRWCGATKPKENEGVVKIVGGLDCDPNVPALYTLYLPLYNQVSELQVGVPEGFTLTPATPDRLKPIVVYGTSIVQGACASRPGLAWTNVLSRALEWPVVNLGFSGNGQMEMEVAELLLEKEAAVYVIDCLPNLTASAVSKRIGPLLDRMREVRPSTPILLVEEAPSDNARWRSGRRTSLDLEWKALRSEYDRRRAKDSNLHYLRGRDLLGADGEATVDAVHPNDVGMLRYAAEYERALRPILGLQRVEPIQGNPAAMQLRELPHYNFLDRHQVILKRNQAVQPEVVWIGDSIIHFFGGEPAGYRAKGPEAWSSLFGETIVTNLGYGWDMTENVLWRIQRGELEGISPKTILLSIGTNDLSYQRTPAAVAEAIGTLVDEIRERQPAARLIVTGLLPRAGFLRKVAAVNARLLQKATGQGFEFVDLAAAFPVSVVDGGETIEGTYDQLHPNEDGYQRMVDLLRPILQK